MIATPGGVKVYLAAGPTDMRLGFDGLAALVQEVLQADPFSGHLFVFRGRRGDRLKALFWDGSGLVLISKRLEEGTFPWPRPGDDVVVVSPSQLAVLLDGLDWRQSARGRPIRRPSLAA